LCEVLVRKFTEQHRRDERPDRRVKRIAPWLALVALCGSASAEHAGSVSVPLPAIEDAGPEAAPPPAAADELPPVDIPAETIDIIEPLPPPGSTQLVGRSELERFERDDVHKALSTVPGVYVREEDGYGLRPNIGMRGAAAERSAKIALLEDDVLIAPAPYSAPAAYYFPVMTRMVSMEVTKGPSAIIYGPNTVGGALNLTSKAIPFERELSFDVAGGSDLYGKLHASYGESWEHFGVLVEGVKLRSSGFKELDGGGDTGFDKNDLMLKARGSVTIGGTDHELSWKGGYSDEVSDETYTGLADRDFSERPYRRYAATQLDRLDWRHFQAQLTHRMSFKHRFSLTTTAYRNDFMRDWRKLNGFRGDRSLAEILASPDAGANAVFYSVLTGATDSESGPETLILGTNERDYVSQGLQTTFRAEGRWLGAGHILEAGLRFHGDEADRLHHEETYAMTAGRLVRDAAPMAVTLDAAGSALAFAAYVKHQVRLGPVQVTGGLRGELVATRWRDHADPTMDDSATYGVVIPGAGLTWQPLPSLGFIAGVHKGFVPVSPGEHDGADPEESVNYEAGVRFGRGPLDLEAIGFFSDYANLKGTCSFSSGCDTSQLDREFNGGEVHIYGVEARAGLKLRVAGLTFPAGASYTLSASSFRTAFQSGNPEWGDVQVGDELPYLPEHQLTVNAGVRGERWELAASTRHTSAMRDVAGQGEVAAADRTEAAHVLDLAASVDFARWGKVYATVDNVLDHAAIVSRRPYGARPGVPRLFVVGYKQTF
jgi:Fe(3+) dicitrate transport protein